MNSSSNPPNSLQKAVQKYKEALEEAFGKEEVEKALQETEDKDPTASEKKPNLSQVLKLLHARDAVQERLEEKPSFEEISCYSSALIHLDQFLKDRSNVIAQNENLVKACKSLKPPESHWWWFLEVKQFDPWWSKPDWLWNAFTIVVLAVASSNIIITAKAFSKGGFDWFGAFTTVVQSGVVVAFAGGALTDKGHKLAEDILTNLEIPKNLHAESTFIMSAGFCALTYLGTQHLPLVGAHYYRQGQIYEKNLKWESAKDQYERALSFLPDDPKVYFALGNTYEFLSDLPNAQKFYKSAFDQGDSASAIRLAKILVIQAFDKTMWNETITSHDQDKTYEQEESKYKFKQTTDRETKLREAELVLDVAEVRINENSLETKNIGYKPGKTTKNNISGPSMDLTKMIKNIERLSPSDMRQLEEINIVKGLLHLMQVNWEESPKEEVSHHLSNASNYFTGLNDLAQCYVDLTKLAKEKIKNKDSQNKDFVIGLIDSMIRSLNSNDKEEVSRGLRILADLTNNTSQEEQTDQKDIQEQYSSDLANYLSLTNEELKEKNQNNKGELKSLLLDKLYLWQFPSYQNAKFCYTRLAQNSKVSPQESYIMSTVLEAKAK